MPRTRTVDVMNEWAAVALALHELETWAASGWARGWSTQQQNEAGAWLLYGRSEGARRIRRLKKILSDRKRRGNGVHP